MTQRPSPLLGVCLALLLAGCAMPQPSKTLTVFAAASLTEPFQEIGLQFEATHPGVKFVFNFAGSQQLYAQLEQGARADVFVSANDKEMNAAMNASLIISGTQRTLARNRLIVIYPRPNPGKITALADLARPRLKLIIADAAVPVGQYTLDMLDKMNRDPAFGPDFTSRVLANVVSREENVKAVVSKIQMGEGDVGIVYASDVTSQTAQELGAIQVPNEYNQIATYPIAPLAHALEPELAEQFIEFTLSPTGQQVLVKYGFIPVQAP